LSLSLPLRGAVRVSSARSKLRFDETHNHCVSLGLLSLGVPLGGRLQRLLRRRQLRLVLLPHLCPAQRVTTMLIAHVEARPRHQ
jgi:hypothetical protein